MNRLHKVLLALGGGLVAVALLLSLPSGGTRAASPASARAGQLDQGRQHDRLCAPIPTRSPTNRRHRLVEGDRRQRYRLCPALVHGRPTSTTMAPAASFGSPSDESLIAAIEEAHRQGLRVMLRPYLDVKDGSWRADITPSDVNAWFANYTAFLDHYLDIAKSHGVEEFTLGVELINMTDPAVPTPTGRH